MMSSKDELEETRILDILSFATEGFCGDEESRARPVEEESNKSKSLNIPNFLRTMVIRCNDDYKEGVRARLEGEESYMSVSLLGKRKSEQNPNHDASSPSLVPEESKRRRVDRERETVRKIKTVRKGKAVRRRNRQAAVIGDEVYTKPEWLINKIREVNGVGAKMIFEKKLTKTDLDSGNTRLLIPWNKIKDMDFLTVQELTIVNENYEKRREKGVDVIFLGYDDKLQQVQRSDLNFRRWDMTDRSYYVLISGWHWAAKYHKLKEGHTIHLWTFHSQNRLCFAAVNLGYKVQRAQPLALVPPPDQDPDQDLALPPPPALALDIAQDSLALALLPASDQTPGPAQAQTLAPGPALGASSSGRAQVKAHARVVRRKPDEKYKCEASDMGSEECRRRIFVDFPRRRRSLRVPFTPQDSKSESKSNDDTSETLLLLAEVCEKVFSDIQHSKRFK